MKTVNKTLKISDVGKILGMGAQTIRDYEKQGIFPKPYVNDKGYRLYSEEDVIKLKAYFVPNKYFNRRRKIWKNKHVLLE